MHVIPLALPEILLIEPEVFSDERGFFFESFNLEKFCEVVGRKVEFVQDNHSKSVKNVLRGLHFQCAPMEQGKLVRVIQGEVFDVVVDIRKNSSTLGQWVGQTLSAENKKQLWIPAGFAHGFLTYSDTAEFLYKTTQYYAPETEVLIDWDDKDLAINWPIECKPILSQKDKKGISFKEYIQMI